MMRFKSCQVKREQWAASVTTWLATALSEEPDGQQEVTRYYLLHLETNPSLFFLAI